MRLNSPNDIVGHSSGLLYFTDPPYGAPARPPPALPGRLQPRPGDEQPGIAPQGLREAQRPRLLAGRVDPLRLRHRQVSRPRLPVEPSGFVDPATGRVFAVQDPETQGGPDGMKVDVAGRVYVAVAQGVWVYEPDGRLLGIIPTPSRPSNLAWRGPGRGDAGDHGRRQGPSDQAEDLGRPAAAAAGGMNEPPDASSSEVSSLAHGRRHGGRAGLCSGPSNPEGEALLEVEMVRAPTRLWHDHAASSADRSWTRLQPRHLSDSQGRHPRAP